MKYLVLFIALFAFSPTFADSDTFYLFVIDWPIIQENDVDCVKAIKIGEERKLLSSEKIELGGFYFAHTRHCELYDISPFGSGNGYATALEGFKANVDLIIKAFKKEGMNFNYKANDSGNIFTVWAVVGKEI